jgi:hypothetical protein
MEACLVAPVNSKPHASALDGHPADFRRLRALDVPIAAPSSPIATDALRCSCKPVRILRL